MSDFKLGPNQEKWLAALESGEYKQGTRCLWTTDNKFCCLCVWCSLSGAKSQGVIMKNGQETHIIDGNYASLSEELFSSLGLISPLGDVTPKASNDLHALFTLNDVKKLSFKEIAAIVRQNPEAYFRESK